jgi:hypothetical protein
VHRTAHPRPAAWADGTCVRDRTLVSGQVRDVWQVDHTGRGGLEPARAQIEDAETIAVVEVDVDPLAACALCVQHSLANEFGADAPALMVGADLRVEQEGMVTSVPRYVDETDRGTVGGSSGNPPETVWPDLVPPTGR